jgi:hypothetical protein
MLATSVSENRVQGRGQEGVVAVIDGAGGSSVIVAASCCWMTVAVIIRPNAALAAGGWSAIKVVVVHWLTLTKNEVSNAIQQRNSSQQQRNDI